MVSKPLKPIKGKRPNKVGPPVLSLSPVGFEQAVRAALATGKAPPPPRRPNKGNVKVPFWEVREATQGGGWAVFELDEEGGTPVRGRERGGWDNYKQAEAWAEKMTMAARNKKAKKSK